MTEKPNAALRELLRHELRGVDPVQLDQAAMVAERVYAPLIEVAEREHRETAELYGRASMRESAERDRAERAEAEAAGLRERLQRAAWEVDSAHHFHDASCTCGFDSHGRARSVTEHITTELLSRLRALASTDTTALARVKAEADNGGGLEARYRVEKINDPTGKHNDCRYFVLDPQHDPTARKALAHYALCTPHLALHNDLRDWIDRIEAEAGETRG